MVVGRVHWTVCMVRETNAARRGRHTGHAGCACPPKSRGPGGPTLLKYLSGKPTSSRKNFGSTFCFLTKCRIKPQTVLPKFSRIHPTEDTTLLLPSPSETYYLTCPKPDVHFDDEDRKIPHPFGSSTTTSSTSSSITPTSFSLIIAIRWYSCLTRYNGSQGSSKEGYDIPMSLELNSYLCFIISIKIYLDIMIVRRTLALPPRAPLQSTHRAEQILRVLIKSDC